MKPHLLWAAAYLVQEKHYFMETVELKGLKYNVTLQDENSAFSIVLSSVLKSKVSPDSCHIESPVAPSEEAQTCSFFTV